MDGVTVIRVVRQVRIIRLGFSRRRQKCIVHLWTDPEKPANINQPGPGAPLVQQQPQLPPPPQRNNRCLNAFALLVIYFVGIGSIVLGALRLNDCPAEKMLPTGLIIFGGMLMVSRLLNCVYDCRSVCEEECAEDTPPCLVLLNLLFCLAEFGMFIAVCYYAFSVDPTTKPEDHALKNYCDYGLYKTSYIGCIIGLIFYGLPFLCGCCAAFCR